MRVRRSLWIVFALLAAIGVAFLVREQGAKGMQSTTEGRPATENAAGLALEGLAPPARSLPPPQDPTLSPPVPPVSDSRVTDDGEIFSVWPAADEVALTLRATAASSGESLQISRVIVTGNAYDIPEGRTARLPVIPGRPVNIFLAESRDSRGLSRLLSLVIVADVTIPAPPEMTLSIPMMDDPRYETLSVVPVDAVTDTELPGAVWEPPAWRDGVESIQADSDGRLRIPLRLLHAEAVGARDLYAALGEGLRVPGYVTPYYAPAPSPAVLAGLLELGELRVPFYSPSGALVERRLRLLGPDGRPSAAARVEVGALELGWLTLRSAADGVVTWQGPPDEDSQVRVFSAAGELLDVFELPSAAGRGSAPTPAVLPAWAAIAVELVWPEPSGEQPHAGPHRVAVELLGRRLAVAGDPTAAARAGASELSEGVRATLLHEPLAVHQPRFAARLPFGRTIRILNGYGSEPRGSRRSLDLVLGGPDRRLVIDWPPTRILSRHER